MSGCGKSAFAQLQNKIPHIAWIVSAAIILVSRQQIGILIAEKAGLHGKFMDQTSNVD